jgi:hypothetical protein
MVNTPAKASEVSNSQGVKNSPMAEGTVAWIIIAPEMFASASSALPWRTQMIAFIVSGSSVAIGESSSATTAAGSPSTGPAHSSCVTKSCEATNTTTSVTSVCARTAAVVGCARLRWKRNGSRPSPDASSPPPEISRRKYTAYAARNRNPNHGLIANATNPSVTFTAKITRNHTWSRASRRVSVPSRSSASWTSEGAGTSGVPAVRARTDTGAERRLTRRRQRSMPPVTP